MKEEFSELVQYLDRKFEDVNSKFRNEEQKLSDLNDKLQNAERKSADLSDKLMNLQNNKADKSDVNNLLNVINNFVRIAETYLKEIISSINKITR